MTIIYYLLKMVMFILYYLYSNTMLAMGEPLPDKNRDHDLSGDWAGHRECHILPDWLLIYRIEDDVLVLTLARTGSHSDLFGK